MVLTRAHGRHWEWLKSCGLVGEQVWCDLLIKFWCWVWTWVAMLLGVTNRWRWLISRMWNYDNAFDVMLGLQCWQSSEILCWSVRKYFTTFWFQISFFFFFLNLSAACYAHYFHINSAFIIDLNVALRVANPQYTDHNFTFTVWNGSVHP